MVEEFHVHDENEDFIVVWEGIYRCSLIPKGQQDPFLHLVVDRKNKIKFFIYLKEGNHNVPHFHACIGNDKRSLSYSINDGRLIEGRKLRARNRKIINAYWKRDHFVLATIWNEKRPTDSNYVQAIVPPVLTDMQDWERENMCKRISRLLDKEWFFPVEGERA